MKDVDRAGAAADIDPLALPVEENIVGVTTGVQLLGRRAGLGVEKDELCRLTEDHGDHRARIVYRHWEIRSQARHRPARRLLCRCEVDDCDVAGIGYIDEYPAGRRIELERFRMRLEFDVADLRFCSGIDDREAAAPVPDDQMAAARIHSDIVGVVAQREAAGRREVVAPEEPYRAVAGAGDDDQIRLLRIGDALRLVELGDLLEPPSARNIHDIERAVPKLRHQQPLAGEVDGHVIDPPGYPGQRDLAVEHQGLL